MNVIYVYSAFYKTTEETKLPEIKENKKGGSGKDATVDKEVTAVKNVTTVEDITSLVDVSVPIENLTSEDEPLVRVLMSS